MMRPFCLFACFFAGLSVLYADLSLPHLDSLTNVIRQSEDNEKKLMAYYNVIEGLYWSGDTTEGDRYLKEMKLFGQANYEEANPGLMSIMDGHRFFVTGKGLRNSLDNTLDGIASLEATERKSKSTVEILAGGYDLAGYTFHTAGAYDLALEYYQKAEKVARIFGFMDLLRVVYNNLSSLYLYELKDREAGLAYLKAALSIAEERHQIRSLGMLNTNLGVFYNSDGNKVAARRHYKKAISYLSQANDSDGLGNAFLGLAQLDYGQGDLEGARAYIEMSIAHAGGDCYWCWDAHYTMGDILWAEKKYGQARERIERGRKVAEKFGEAEGALDGIFLLAKLEDHLGNWEKASLLFKKGLRSKDSLQDIWNINKIAEIQAANELSKLYWEKGILLEEKELLDSKVSFQKKSLALIAALLFLAVISGASIYISRRQLRRSNQKLVEKNRLLIEKNIRDHSKRDASKPSALNAVAASPSGIDRPNGENPESNAGENATSTEADLNPAEENLVEKIRAVFEKEEVFMEDELTLASLAQKLNTNTTYLSNVINQTYGKGFRRVVNEYRVQRVLECFERGEFRTLTIFAIAQKAGFKSKSSFNSAFLQYTGVTPTFYIKNLEE